MLAEALGWSLALGRGGLSGLSTDEIQPEPRSQELVELSTMSYWSTHHPVLPLDMVENSINSLRTHFGLIFSSFNVQECTPSCRSTRPNLLSPSPSHLQPFRGASSRFIHAHSLKHGTGGKG